MKESERKLARKSSLQVFFKPLFDLWTHDVYDQYVTLAIVRFQSLRVRDVLANIIITGKDRYNYTGYLAELIAYEKPPRNLLKALSSPDARIRLSAAQSLYESGSPVLVPYIKQLARDADPKVRIASAIIALKLAPPDWDKVRPSLLALLSDPDSEVRGKVAGLLADKEGKKPTPTAQRLPPP